MNMQCVTIRNSQIASNLSLQKLLLSGIEELFVIDHDAIFKNRMNFHTYQELSKYFEIVVMSLPLRVEDLMDSFIAGAGKVVIAGRSGAYLVENHLKMSESEVLCYQDPSIARSFYGAGGREFLSDRALDFPGSLIYSYSKVLSGDRIVQLVDFPRDDLLDVLY